MNWDIEDALKQALPKELQERINTLLQASYERGDFKPHVDVLEQLQPSPGGISDQGYGIALEVQKAAAQSLTATHDPEMVAAVCWGFVNALVTSVVLDHGLSPETLVEMLRAAGASALKVRESRDARFASGVFDCIAEAKEIRQLHAHIKPEQSKVQPQAVGAFHIPGDGRVH